MAIARLTLCPDATLEGRQRKDWTLFAPTAAGEWVPADYDGRERAGRLGRVGAARDALAEHLCGGPAPAAGQPLAVLVHGFSYEPRIPLASADAPAQNPHRHVLRLDETGEAPGGPRERTERDTPWPRRLGFADDKGQTGLALCFGWSSNPAYESGTWTDLTNRLLWTEEGLINYYAKAYNEAPITAAALAETVEALALAFPHHEIDLFSHSLGSRVALGALVQLADERPEIAARLGRVILLSGAAFHPTARVAADALSRIGAAPQIFNMLLRLDWLLGIWGRRCAGFLPPQEFCEPDESWGGALRRLLLGARVLGIDGVPPRCRYDRWLDVALDSKEGIAWAEGVEPPLDFNPDWLGSRLDHWVTYTWPDFMEFYRRILRERADWSVEALREGRDGCRPIPPPRFISPLRRLIQR